MGRLICQYLCCFEGLGCFPTFKQEMTMTEMNPLRRRMIDDMTIRNLSPATQRCYLHAVAKFSRYFGRSPDRLGLEDVRAFEVHLVSLGISWPALNQTVCALRFFYGVTHDHHEIPERIAHRQQKLDLCRRLLNARPPEPPAEEPEAKPPPFAHRCPCCGGIMSIIGTWNAAKPTCRPAWNDSS